MNKISPDEPVYVISVAARLVGLHEQTLRIYEKKGLVVPRRTDKKTRLYSMNDLKKLRLIKLLTQKRGLNLAGVKMILEMIDDIDRALKEFEEELDNLL
ncbi:MAG: MerR family transcriptional regulator [Candidatus Hydrothermota bacterium]|nr:MAG: MerR family transcriptional regulator [Candidatus Hydrothermae bacterium]